MVGPHNAASEKRHPKREPGLLWRRRNVDCAAMRLGDLGGDVEAEAQAVLAWLRPAAKKRLKEPRGHSLRQRGRASLFVDLPCDEMAPLIEIVVDLGVN